MISPEQCKAARVWLDMTQDDLAKASGVALSTIRDFESRERIPVRANIETLGRTLEAAGATFLFDGDQATGVMVRPRITEHSLILPALDLLNHMDDGFYETSELIGLLQFALQPAGKDNEILDNRSDTRFSQIVRNMVSHRKSPSNLIGAGYATYDKTRRGLVITGKGRAYLEEHIEELSPEWLNRVGR
jgi:transcriptional regulator with XRE-family HTH domain